MNPSPFGTRAPNTMLDFAKQKKTQLVGCEHAGGDGGRPAVVRPVLLVLYEAQAGQDTSNSLTKNKRNLRKYITRFKKHFNTFRKYFKTHRNASHA